ncbi:glycosyltransferase family 4 protein [Paenibacillus sp. GP183]|uniref:glycosyltransferase family 4 protein n=1 Tax=Paenibacillus sp. GP183 TaxID=1882751 RepID=UPI000898F2CA|nr:glycosyltransferase family 4 protein [Paenibacillus sp. GP183]SEC07059.1 glycosyltransferase EpsD [Paenibacillus sp. GP183]
MAKKVLFCATVDYHFKAFHLPYLNWFKEQGWEVHIAASGNMELPHINGRFDIPIQRSPFKRRNLEAYNQLKLIIDENQYDIVHCHTPMGGVIARLAARGARRNGTKVIYTAHGFHFCKGAPLLNWLVYYPIERMLSHFTDCLITINEEDYALAVYHRFKAKRIEHVHGVGVNTDRYKPIDEIQKRESREVFGYQSSDFLMFYAAEFNENKNQQLLIQALALLKVEAPQAKLLLAGDGPFQEACRELAVKLEVEGSVHFLGHRNDIPALLPLCDVALASSLREGLPVNILEAMACGLPVVASENRGHSELVKDTVNGFVIRNLDSRQFAARLVELYKSDELRKKFGVENIHRVQRYSLAQVGLELSGIYTQYFLGDRDEAEDKYSSAYI